MKTINLLSLILTALFWVMFMGRTVMLMLRGVKVFTMAKNGKAVEKLLELCTVPLMLLWTTGVAFSAFGKFPLSGLFVLPVLQWVGLGLCLVGLAIFLAALISFGSSWRVGIDPENCNRLVTSGAFAFSRNPIFLFMNIFFHWHVFDLPKPVFPRGFPLLCHWNSSPDFKRGKVFAR